MSTPFKTTNLNSWLEWKEMCALHLCKPDEQRDLGSWAHGKLASAIADKSPDYRLPTEQTLSDSMCGDSGRPRWVAWHLFETYMHASSGKTGKRWKDWLLEKAERDARIDVLDESSERLLQVFTEKLEANACSCIQTTVALRLATAEGDWKARIRGFRIESGDAPLRKAHDEGDATSFFDWFALGIAEDIPDNRLALKQLEELAARLADEYFLPLNRRARVGLAFSAEGFSLNDREIVAAAECNSAARIYEAINFKRVDGGRIIKELAEIVTTRHPNEDRRSLKYLILEAFKATVGLCIEWAKMDDRCASIFEKMRKPGEPTTLGKE